ncbi:MAG: hypothetical protein IPH72_14320 [Sandaracinaceae bacterium]|nr:hypothetical protein [Sandaracinaceae bacterium]
MTVGAIAGECSPMDINTQDLRATLAALPTSGRGRRYTPELRDQVVAAVRSARDAGQTWDAIAVELGVPAITLKRWVEPVAVSRDVKMRPVRVVAESESLTLVTLSGHRVTGLDIATAVELLRRLEA